MQWYTPTIPAHTRLRQKEDQKFKTSLGHKQDLVPKKEMRGREERARRKKKGKGRR